MIYYISRDGVERGPLDEGSLKHEIANGITLPTDYYWREGMTDWELVSTLPWQAVVPPVVPKSTKQSRVAKWMQREETQLKNRSPAYIGGILTGCAAFLPLANAGLFLVSLSLLFAAFILAIVALVRGKILGGICLLIFLPIALIVSWTCLVDRDRLLSPEGRAAIKAEAEQGK